MDKLLFVLTQKAAIGFVMTLGLLGNILASSHPVSQTPATAIVAENFGSTLSTGPSIDLPEVPPGLLPVPKTQFCAASSTCAKKGLQTLVANAFRVAKKDVVVTPVKLPNVPSVVATTVVAPTHLLTASEFLANTITTFRETRDGPFVAIFQTNVNGTTVTWGTEATTVGGAGTIASFSVAISCDPAAGNPMLFMPKTAYTCTVSLTPMSGADERMQTKSFSFTTPVGQLYVTPSPGNNTVLSNDSNYASFVIDNEDNSPVTVTGLTFDVSYVALNTLTGPLVLRFSDPLSGDSLFDYHLENLPKTSSMQYTNGAENVQATFSFPIGAGSQRGLSISILGVQTMLMPDVNPSVSVVLRRVGINRNDEKVTIAVPRIFWSCTVALNGYNPNATSDVFATGQACR
jgi:hypothetical protein